MMTKSFIAALAILLVAASSQADWRSRSNSYRATRQSRQYRTETYLFPQSNRMIISEDVGGGNYYIQSAPITVYGQGYGQLYNNNLYYSSYPSRSW